MVPESLRYPDPPLCDGRIGLRKWDEGDLDCVRLAGTDPAIPAGTTVPATYTAAEGLAFIQRQWSRADRGEGLFLAIVDVSDDRAIGLVSIAMRPQQHVAGLGYWVVPSERGKGVATAAVRLVSPWALNALGLQRLEAWTEPENLRSQAVLRSAGFEHEGRLRNFLRVDEHPVDAMVFAVLGSGV